MDKEKLVQLLEKALNIAINEEKSKAYIKYLEDLTNYLLEKNEYTDYKDTLESFKTEEIQKHKIDLITQYSISDQERLLRIHKSRINSSRYNFVSISTILEKIDKIQKRIRELKIMSIEEIEKIKREELYIYEKEIQEYNNCILEQIELRKD